MVGMSPIVPMYFVDLSCLGLGPWLVPESFTIRTQN